MGQAFQFGNLKRPNESDIHEAILSGREDKLITILKEDRAKVAELAEFGFSPFIRQQC